MFLSGARRKLPIFAVVCVLGMLGAACGGDDEAPSPAATNQDGQPEVTDITHALAFPVIPFAAPYYVGVEKGFFEEVGLNVEYVPGESGASSVGAVQAGSAQFGNADLIAMSLAKKEDPSFDVVQIYFVFTKPANVIYSLKSGANITRPEQLADVTIYTEPGSIGRDIINGWAADQGLPEMTFKDVDFEARDRLLVTGRLPAVAGFLSTKGLLEGAAAETGEEIVTLELADHGLDIITSGISVKRSFAEENPNTVRAYLSALWKSYVFSFENKEEAGEIMNSLYPDISPESVIGSMASLEYTMSADGTVPPEQYGLYDPARLEETVDFINRIFGTDLTSDDLVMPEFVNEIDREM